MVVEIDGEIHEQIDVQIKDKNREDELKELGLEILRIKNSEIVENMALSLDKIKKMIDQIIQSNSEQNNSNKG